MPDHADPVDAFLADVASRPTPARCTRCGAPPPLERDVPSPREAVCAACLVDLLPPALTDYLFRSGAQRDLPLTAIPMLPPGWRGYTHAEAFLLTVRALPDRCRWPRGAEVAGTFPLASVLRVTDACGRGAARTDILCDTLLLYRDDAGAVREGKPPPFYDACGGLIEPELTAALARVEEVARLLAKGSLVGRPRDDYRWLEERLDAVLPALKARCREQGRPLTWALLARTLNIEESQFARYRRAAPWVFERVPHDSRQPPG